MWAVCAAASWIGTNEQGNYPPATFKSARQNGGVSHSSRRNFPDKWETKQSNRGNTLAGGDKFHADAQQHIRKRRLIHTLHAPKARFPPSASQYIPQKTSRTFHAAFDYNTKIPVTSYTGRHNHPFGLSRPRKHPALQLPPGLTAALCLRLAEEAEPHECLLRKACASISMPAAAAAS